MTGQNDQASSGKVTQFKDTLNLPRTDFPIRPNAKIEDNSLLERWKKEHLSRSATQLHEGTKKYILHDGPPYANGHIHLGHAYNKILKDIISKSHRMQGYHVPVIPGWDCHGLPIEQKVSKEHPGLSRTELKKACRSYAQGWVDVQKEEFKTLGVLFDWDNPYLTMSAQYEADTIRAFGLFVAQGYIEKKKKTVPWCPFDQTVLATAEIEYQDRKDPSIYVEFPLSQKAKKALFPTFADAQVSFLVWTTTPWTLPLNRAVALKPKAVYQVLQHQDRYIIVAQELADAVTTQAEIEKKVVAEKFAEDFTPYLVEHPFIDGLEVPVILDPFISLEDGTACVHCAPGCGPQDYDLAIKNNLPIYSPITTDGKYAQGIEPHELMGMSVADGQGWVITKLLEKGRLFLKKSIKHSYPHCWRCHNPLIFRATDQWFCNLERHDLRKRALAALETTTFFPERSKNFLKATLEGRLEWCLSRQRVWGTPIPALLCKKCGFPYITTELIEKVAQGVAKENIEYWDRVTIEDLVGKNHQCRSCSSTEFVKEQDILDVWFDAGISHYAVLEKRADQTFPADIYVEGVDQHRGWFQSSWLTSMVIEKTPCTKAFLTHGFTVDAKGHKMSKSLGNVVPPSELIEKLGTDGLRLWAASINYEGDAIVSQVLLNNVAEVYRKIRNTARFLLSNLYDFDHIKDAVAIKNLRILDQYALERLYAEHAEILKKYEVADFTGIFHALADYCAVDLSAFYLDVVKDRLYVESAAGHERRSAQTVCWYILDSMTKLMAPILSFTAEHISDNYQKNKQVSIHLQKFNNPEKDFGAVHVRTEQWQLILKIRSAILKAIEVQREQGVIKHPLEARLTLHFDFDFGQQAMLDTFMADMKAVGQTPEDFFKELMVVSQVEIVADRRAADESELHGFFVHVNRAEGQKCPRCWNYDTHVNADGLCRRCQKVLGL